MFWDLEHPEITCAMRTGYPSWMQDDDDCDGYDPDEAYEERRHRELFGDD